MSFLSMFLEEVKEKEKWAHHNYHRAIKEEKDINIAYFGQQYEVLNSIRRTLDVSEFQSAIKEIFEEIDFSLQKKGYEILERKEKIQSWTQEDAPLKYQGLFEDQNYTWLALVPKKYENLIDDQLKTRYSFILKNYEKINVPWNPNLFVYGIWVY